MVESRSRVRMKYLLAAAWLVFTLSFAAWWMYFVLGQLNVMGGLLPDHLAELSRHRRMMVWEGAAWMILLAFGGAMLISFVAREERRSHELKEFFAAFSHDVKTSLASLRLQAECLQEDLAGRAEQQVLGRLVADTVRLHLQLQNSLFLVSQEDLKIYFEELRLSEIVASLRHQWPNLKLETGGDCILKADERALQSVLANLVHNSVVHGGASAFRLTPVVGEVGGLAATDAGIGARRSGQVSVEFSDDGSGFQGDVKKLGRLFHRHSSASGSGVGLYICRDLVARMNGRLEFNSEGAGFGGRITLPGRLV